MVPGSFGGFGFFLPGRPGGGGGGWAGEFHFGQINYLKEKNVLPEIAQEEKKKVKQFFFAHIQNPSQMF
jgi:hypothetical protein